LSLLVFLLYRPAIDFRLLSFDDYYYTQNDLVSGGLNRANIARIFTEFPEEDLVTPLTQLSYMADVDLFGNSPRGFHLTNVLLHAVNMGLLLLVLWRMTGSLWKSALAAALVGFHPMRAESVAWVTERKDVLSFFFLLLTMGCYARYARTGRWGWYAAVFLCALLGMLAKPVAVTLPVLLLLLDYWPLGRLHTDPWESGSRSPWRNPLILLAEKIPLFLISILFSLATLYLQGERAIHTGVPILSRLEHSLSSVFVYLYRTFLPKDLPFLFFQTPWDRFSGTFLPSAAGFAVVTAIVLRCSGSRPFLAFGWSWYLVSLLPSSGIVPSGIQWISDRFTYIPHIGLAVAVVWTTAGAARPVLRRALPIAVGLLLLPLAFLSRQHLYHWKDGATLFGKGVSANLQDPIYLSQYIEELLHIGDYAEARRRLDRADRFIMDPKFGALLQIHRLALLEKTGDRSGAVEQAKVYLRGDPRFFKTRLRLADNLSALGRYEEAAVEYRKVLEVPILTIRVRRYVAEEAGYALLMTGKDDEAMALYTEAARGGEWSPSLHGRMALLLDRRGNRVEALAHYEKSIEMNPNGVQSRIGVADLLLEGGRVNAAVRQFEAVARIVPGNAEGFYARGRVLEAAGMLAEARSLYENALKAPALLPETGGKVRGRLASMKPP
jgi:tetratricopeptide (TPR) repeat protein